MISEDRLKADAELWKQIVELSYSPKKNAEKLKELYDEYYHTNSDIRQYWKSY